VTFGRPYQLAVHSAAVEGGTVEISTLAGIARRAVETYWPLVAAPMGFAHPEREPLFLNIETAQYFMARIAAPTILSGQFDAVNVSPQRIISQVLDNLNKAALLRFPLDDVANRLVTAWGERHSSRPPVYQTAIDLAAGFRTYCLRHNLLDFSLMVEAFTTVLLNDPQFSAALQQRYDYLIADNVEEDNPASHDFIRWLLPHLKGALVVYDTEAGYRFFLGADAEYAYRLADACETRLTMEDARVASPALVSLGNEFRRSLGPEVYQPPETNDDNDPLTAFQFAFNQYYPQMIDWTADRIIELIGQGVEPREIAVLAPYLNDSLRFGLTYRLNQANVPTLSHRPSRALHDEPATRALLTITALAHPTWSDPRPVADVADAFSQVIGGLDPVRARLLASIVYRTGGAQLSSFKLINPQMQERISFVVGERYEELRDWLARFAPEAGSVPLDHFLRRLFGELLSQPGYGFHDNLEAGRIASQLIESAQRFRQTLYTEELRDWNGAGREYLAFVQQRLFAGLHVQSWRDEDSNAVFLAPIPTFLLRNRFVDYQFWLDVGSNSWWERLDQPLTQPYVLRRSFPDAIVWNDDMEYEAQEDMLYRTVMGLSRRCRKKIYLGITSLGEEGFEQRGPLLRVFQQILSRHTPDQPTQNQEAA
jgi:UvrD-like helicase family protein